MDGAGARDADDIARFKLDVQLLGPLGHRVEVDRR
jgi:hypothetical protein